jgi:hypothetical protein
MAKNTGEGYRKGAVDDRTQIENPKTKKWTKRKRKDSNENAGQFMEVRKDGEPFKGVAKEPDERRRSDDE